MVVTKKGWLDFVIAKFLLDEMFVILKAVIILWFSPNYISFKISSVQCNISTVCKG